MKTRTKILLSVLGVIVIIISVTIVFQWSNIKALVYYLRYSDTEITELVQDNNELINSALNKIPDITVRDLSDEEREMLNAGEITPEEAVAMITGKAVSSKQTEPNSSTPLPKEGEKKVEGQAEEQDDPQTRSDELIAQIYILRARFTNSLDGLKNDAIAEYRALPQDSRTSAVKQEIGMRYLQLALSLEGECDSAMNELLTELEAELKKTGGDVSVVADIKSIYANEKSLKKAEYLSMYS